MKLFRPWFAAAACSCAAILAIWLWPRDEPSRAAIGPGTSLSGAPGPAARPEPDRVWRLESLDELDFDQALTLLAAEARPGPPGERTRAVLERIEALHAENLLKIEAAAVHYARLPAKAQRRFAQVREEYARRHGALRAAVERWEAGDPRAAKDLESLLRETGAWSPPRGAPSREDLSGPRLRPALRSPRASKEEWREGERVGRAGAPGRTWLEELLATPAAWAEEASADLGATPEVVITEEIRRLAVEDLGGSPARVAAWVAQNIEYAAVHGALQTSEGCFRTRRGSAADIASLTIALLRAAGTPARYRAGTVRIPAEAAKSWLGGFEDANAAASLLATGGVPTVVELGADGKPAFLRFEHVWVRAFVDFVPGRGACAGPGDTWVDLDTAIKTRVHVPRPALDDFLDERPGDGAFNESEFRARIQTLLDTASRDPASGALRGLDLAEIESFLEEKSAGAFGRLVSGAGDLSVAVLAGRAPVAASGAVAISAAPPFTVLASGWERPDLPDSLRWKIAIRLIGADGVPVLSHELPAPSLGSSRFGIGYAPGEGALEILVSQLESLPGAPLVQSIHVAGVNVVPRLLRDGIPEATAGPSRAVPMGSALEIVVELASPTLSIEPVRAAHTAGALTAIGIDLESVPGGLFESLQAEVVALRSALEDPAHRGDGARILEALLSAAAHGWFQSLDRLGEIAVGSMGCAVQRLPSAGVVSSILHPDRIFGLPLSVTQGGLNVDMPGDRVALIARDGSDARAARAGIARGFLASSLESLVPAELFHDGSAPEHWLSSANALRSAALNGDRMLLLRPDAAGMAGLSALRLSAGDIETIRDALERGLTVYTHATPFRGRSGLHAGFAILDPVTGSGSYRVSSGSSGGDSVECSSCESQGPCCHSPQGCNGPLDFFLRFWSGQFQEDLFSTLVGELPDDVSGAISSVTSVIDAYTKNADLMDAALGSVPEEQRDSLRPLVGMVVLMTGLQAVSDLFCPDFAAFACEQYMSIVQGTAWKGVRNVLLYRARTDLAIEGIDMSFECLEQLIEED